MMNPLNDSMLFGFHRSITDEQRSLLKAILAPTEEAQIIIVEASAGTGKTLISAMGAKLRGKKMRYIFSPVNEDELGYLPGELNEKEAPYLAPLKQALLKLRDDPSKINNGTFWVSAHSHVYERGVNYEDETVIIEEAQNFTLHQLRKILTRCADSCKVILIGNDKQIDLCDTSLSGFKPYRDYSYGESWIKRINLTTNFRGRISSWADNI
jgi:phosphate starvation-inducible protein PhoH and related proteins